MSSYEKFDPSVIKKRIKDGEYDSLTGANRAIGKTQNLSDEDRDALKKYAAKHFGVEAAPAKKKAAKKTATKAPKAAKAAPAPKAAVAKKASKRAAKKVGKKAAKKAATKSAADSEAATQSVAAEKQVPPAKPVAGKGRVAKAASPKQLTLPFSSKPQEVVQMMGAVIGSVSQMLESMKLATVLYPKATLAESVPTAVRTLTRAVSVLEQAVVSPLDHDKVAFTAAKEPAAKAKAKPAAKAPAKRERPVGARPVATEAPEEDAPDSGPPQGGGLSEEDQEEFNQLQSLVAAGDDEG